MKKNPFKKRIVFIALGIVLVLVLSIPINHMVRGAIFKYYESQFNETYNEIYASFNPDDVYNTLLTQENYEKVDKLEKYLDNMQNYSKGSDALYAAAHYSEMKWLKSNMQEIEELKGNKEAVSSVVNKLEKRKDELKK